MKRILLEYNFAGDGMFTTLLVIFFFSSHSLLSSPTLDSAWFTRGILVISNDKVTSLPSYTLTDGQYSQLKEAAVKKTNGLVKIRARLEKDPLEASRYSFVKACSLYQSSLSDLISVYFDSTGSFMGLSVATHNPHCSVLTDVPLKSFNSTVEVYSTTNGPLPDTQTYLLRLEQEKHEKLRGEKGDNRSFLAKYVSIARRKLFFEKSLTGNRNEANLPHPSEPLKSV